MLGHHSQIRRIKRFACSAVTEPEQRMFIFLKLGGTASVRIMKPGADEQKIDVCVNTASDVVIVK